MGTSYATIYCRVQATTHSKERISTILPTADTRGPPDVRKNTRANRVRRLQERSHVSIAWIFSWYLSPFWYLLSSRICKYGWTDCRRNKPNHKPGGDGIPHYRRVVCNQQVRQQVVRCWLSTQRNTVYLKFWLFVLSFHSWGPMQYEWAKAMFKTRLRRTIAR